MKKIKAPFIGPDKIENTVNALKNQYGILNNIPVDIEQFAAFELGIDIIPEPGIRQDCGCDAIITGDFNSILVDAVYYENDSYINRFRFSIAHELGHKFLHEDFFKQLGIDSNESWLDFMDSEICDKDYSMLEYHANLFAGMILMPKDQFLLDLQNKTTPQKLSSKYGVSVDAIKKRSIFLLKNRSPYHA